MTTTVGTEKSEMATVPNSPTEINLVATFNNLAIRNRMAECLATVLARQDLGFWQMPARTHLWDAAAEAANRLRERHQQLVVVGIGGSSLGARTLCQALLPSHKQQHVFFIDHLDEQLLDGLLNDRVKNIPTAWAIVSKSGQTMETLAVVDWMRNRLGQSYFHSQNTTVITEKTENPLNSWSNQRQISQLEIPKDVGGRYSVFTAAGILPYLFAKPDGEALRIGAQSALAQ